MRVLSGLAHLARDVLTEEVPGSEYGGDYGVLGKGTAPPPGGGALGGFSGLFSVFIFKKKREAARELT